MLMVLANALKPPTPPSKDVKYYAKVVLVENLRVLLSANAFGHSEGLYDFDQDFAVAQELSGAIASNLGASNEFNDDDDDDTGLLAIDSLFDDQAYHVKDLLFDNNRQPKATAQ